MENLARALNSPDSVREDVARSVVSELERCGIPVQAADPGRDEVPYQHIGKLGAFTFLRAWCYWVVRGPVPLEVAKELYADRIGKTDIRVAGHCGCPPPEYPWVAYFAADGRRIYSDNPAAEAVRAVVESYHIDTELGLYVFVNALRKHGVVA